MNPLEKQIRSRLATFEDAVAIEKLTRQQISEKSEPFDQKRFEWGMLRRLFDPLQKKGFMIAEEIEKDSKKTRGELVGIIFAELRVDPFGRSEAYIKQLYVKEQFRNRGIGHKLLAKMIAHLKELDIHIIQAYVLPGSDNIFRMLSDLEFQNKFIIMELNLKKDIGGSELEAGVQ